jgi:hypothetical protein
VNLALDALDEKSGRDTSPVLPTLAEVLKESEEFRSGKKLPQSEFREPLLSVLMELGGSAHVSKIRKLMEKRMAPLLKDGDYEKVSTGEVRWWNATCWERANMVRDGLIAESEERGVWELATFRRKNREPVPLD